MHDCIVRKYHDLLPNNVIFCLIAIPIRQYSIHQHTKITSVSKTREGMLSPDFIGWVVGFGGERLRVVRL